MTKRTITIIWLVGIGVMIVGGLIALFSALALAILGGIVTQFVAWIGAVINTNRLVDKTWFNVLLWCGVAAIVLSLITGGLGTFVGWGLMIAYLVGGPDGMAVQPMLLRATPTQPPRTLAPVG